MNFPWAVYPPIRQNKISGGKKTLKLFKMVKNMKKTIQFFEQIMTPPHTHHHDTHTYWAKSSVYRDFKMASNENALTQTKCEIGITGIIQNVFQGD